MREKGQKSLLTVFNRKSCDYSFMPACSGKGAKTAKEADTEHQSYELNVYDIKEKKVCPSSMKHTNFLLLLLLQTSWSEKSFLAPLV